MVCFQRKHTHDHLIWLWSYVFPVCRSVIHTQVQCAVSCWNREFTLWAQTRGTRPIEVLYSLLLHSKFFPSHVFVCWCVFSGQSSFTRLPDWCESESRRREKERESRKCSLSSGRISRGSTFFYSCLLFCPHPFPSFPDASLSADGLHFLLMSFICLASSQLSLPDAWLTARRREKGNEEDRERVKERKRERASDGSHDFRRNTSATSIRYRAVYVSVYLLSLRTRGEKKCSDGLSLISLSLQGRLEERGRDEARTQLSIVIRAGGGYFYYYGTDERSSPSLFFSLSHSVAGV